MHTSDDTPVQSAGFREIGIAPNLLKILDAGKITQPTPIQHQAIPPALEGKDLIGIAQTGTGKTFAFGLPMLQRMAEGKKRALIILPTRELAYQVEESLRPFAQALSIRMAVIIGGVSVRQQQKMIRANPRVLVATPGRLNDLLMRNVVTLKEVEILVLDEADRMLDMGFKPQIDRILARVPRARQTLLFSATMPQEIVKLATREMRLPLRIEVARSGTTAAKVEQEVIIVRQQEKGTLLQSLLREYDGQVLVFSRTKHGAKKMTRSLYAAGFQAAEIHANRSPAQRRAALAGFKGGTYRILVATDIASRGIDVTGIELVINYDIPDDPSDYVHRIGRTGRADRAGRAISFATPTQAKNLRDIERLISISIPRKQHTSLPRVPLEKQAVRQPTSPWRAGRRSQRHYPSSSRRQQHGRSGRRWK